MLDITPHEKISTWKSDEYSQLKVSWFSGEDLSDYDEIHEQKNIACKRCRIFGLSINRKITQFHLYYFKTILSYVFFWY